MRRVAVWSLVCAAAVTAAGEGAADPPKKPPAASCARKHPGLGAARAGGARQGGSVALARTGKGTIAYVADEDAQLLRTFDLEANVERARTKLAGSPSQALVLADGRVAVALRDQNQVAVLEPGARPEEPLETLCAFDVAAEPVALAATPDDERLLVSSAWGKRLAAYEVTSFARKLDVELPREPRAVVVDDDGERAFVAHVVGAKLSVVDLAGPRAGVHSVDLAVKTQRRGAGEGRVQGGCQGFALAKVVEVKDLDQDDSVRDGPPLRPPPPTPPAPRPPSSRPAPPAPKPAPAPAPAVPPQVELPSLPAPRGRLFAPMVTVDAGEPGHSSSGYGSSNRSAAEVAMVSVVDAAAERALTSTVLADDGIAARECILPRAASYVPGLGSVLVACMGVDAVL